MAMRRVQVGSRVGLHARPAAVFVRAVTARSAPITLARAGGAPVDARSILAVLGLGLRYGEEVVIECEGLDEEALEELAALLATELDPAVAQ